MRNFRVLNADEIEVRISEISKKGNYLTLLLYKTARTDAALLDETVGMYDWQNDYKLLDGKMYCGIGIKSGEEWVWKWNVGTESNTEAEKGEASDALKRAGFVWGIGTELYSAPRIKVWSDKAKIEEYQGKYRCYDSFSVKSIAYDKMERISELVIWNDTQGKECFSWKAGQTPAVKKEPEKPKEPDGPVLCSKCGAEIKPLRTKSGREMSVKEYVSLCMTEFGAPVCNDCRRKKDAA